MAEQSNPMPQGRLGGPELTALAGGTAIVVGAGMIYLPAGVIVAGVLLIMGAILSVRA